jgi:uridine phosphorylase
MQNVIQPSELIITDAGCIYHLDLHPSELADTVITVGDPGRVAEVAKYFDKIEVNKQHREFVSCTGYIGSKRITVLSTGIGPDNIDICLNELDALVNIDFDTRTVKEDKKSLKIIRLGTSGTVQKDIEVDSLVAGSYGIGMDNLLHYYHYEPTITELELLDKFKTHVGITNNNYIQPYLVQGSVGLLNHFMDVCHYGITMTAPGFYGPQGRVLRLDLAMPHLIDSLNTFHSGDVRITNIEMETSAIYGLGKLMGHQCLSVNTIIANRAAKTFTKDGAASVENMIKTCLEIIEKI